LAKDFEAENKKITVVGGGMTGCEVAENFALKGNKVTLVEMQDKLAPEVSPDNLVTVLENLNKTNSDILLSHKLIKIDNSEILVENLNEKEKVTIPTDLTILSLGGYPDNELYNELVNQISNVHLIGDSIKVGRIAQAVQTGFETAYVAK